MGNFSIKTLARMMMMMMMMIMLVYTAAITDRKNINCDRATQLIRELGEIKDEANKLLNKTGEELNETVLSPAGAKPGCPTEFFCLAEKSLKELEKGSKDFKGSKLIRQLDGYNNQTHRNCHFHRNITCTARTLLNNTTKCVDAKIQDIKHKCPTAKKKV